MKSVEQSFIDGEDCLSALVKEVPFYEAPETLADWLKDEARVTEDQHVAPASPEQFEPPEKLRDAVLREARLVERAQTVRRHAVWSAITRDENIAEILGAPVSEATEAWLRWQAKRREALRYEMSAFHNHAPKPGEERSRRFALVFAMCFAFVAGFAVHRFWLTPPTTDSLAYQQAPGVAVAQAADEAGETAEAAQLQPAVAANADTKPVADAVVAAAAPSAKPNAEAQARIEVEREIASKRAEMDRMEAERKALERAEAQAKLEAELTRKRLEQEAQAASRVADAASTRAATKPLPAASQQASSANSAAPKASPSAPVVAVAVVEEPQAKKVVVSSSAAVVDNKRELEAAQQHQRELMRMRELRALQLGREATKAKEQEQQRLAMETARAETKTDTQFKSATEARQPAASKPAPVVTTISSAPATVVTQTAQPSTAAHQPREGKAERTVVAVATPSSQSVSRSASQEQVVFDAAARARAESKAEAPPAVSAPAVAVAKASVPNPEKQAARQAAAKKRAAQAFAYPIRGTQWAQVTSDLAGSVLGDGPRVWRVYVNNPSSTNSKVLQERLRAVLPRGAKISLQTVPEMPEGYARLQLEDE